MLYIGIMYSQERKQVLFDLILLLFFEYAFRCLLHQDALINEDFTAMYVNGKGNKENSLRIIDMHEVMAL